MPRHLVEGDHFQFPVRGFSCVRSRACASVSTASIPVPGAVSSIALATQPDGEAPCGRILWAAGRRAPQRPRAIQCWQVHWTRTSDPGVSGEVFALVVQPDGQILVGGYLHDAGWGRAGHSASPEHRPAQCRDRLDRRDVRSGYRRAGRSPRRCSRDREDTLVGRVLHEARRRSDRHRAAPQSRAAQFRWLESTQVSIRAPELAVLHESPCSPMTRF